jgi:hypothetical protein
MRSLFDREPISGTPTPTQKMVCTLAACGWQNLTDGFALGPIASSDLERLKLLAAQVFRTAIWRGATMIVKGEEARAFFRLYRSYTHSGARPPSDPDRPWVCP